MKLRLKNNVIRLRLTRNEIKQFAETGCIQETIEFGTEAHQQFTYALETDAKTETVHAKKEGNRITILMPKPQAERWTNTEQIGIETEQSIGDGKTLHLLIEKDFSSH